MSDSSVVVAILVLLVIVIMIAIVIYNIPPRKDGYKSVEGAVAISEVSSSSEGPTMLPPGLPAAMGGRRRAVREGMAGLRVSPDEMNAGDTPARRSVYSALARPYSTADVDPLITGQLYGYAEGVRNIYAERSAHGNGLDEYSSSGGSGDVGVDVGPYGLDEYGSKEAGYDDGIPAQWAMPSTPIRWYAPKQRDHYGPEGPTPYSEGLYTLAEPDHDPLVG